MTVVPDVLAERRPLAEAAPAPTARARRSASARFRRLLPPVVMFVVVIALWQLVSSTLSSGRQFLLPPPLDVLRTGFLDRQTLDVILPALGRSAELSVVGLLVAMALGVAVGTVLYRFHWLERAAYPYLVALQAIPILAISSLIAVAFGYTFFAKGIIVVMIAFFPIPTNLLLGLKSVDRGMIDLFALHRAGWLTRFWKLALPSALPQLFTGFRISAGLAVIGAVVGEQFFQSGAPGLGMAFMQYVNYVEYAQVYACIILASLLGIALYSLFTWLSRRLFGQWHQSAQLDDAAALPQR